MEQDTAKGVRLDIYAIVNTSRLPQKESRGNFSRRRKEGGNAAVTEMVPIITKVHLPCIVKLPGIRWFADKVESIERARK